MTQSAVTIGNFDGVHAGHRQLLRRVVAIGRAHGWTPAVLTFDPHPTKLVAPERAPKLMTTPEQRRALMQSEGIERVEILPFTTEVSRLTPEDFVRQILVDRLGAKAVVVGENFRFGHRAAGDVESLRALGEKYGFTTEALPGVSRRNRMVSSSEVRRLLALGNVSLACRLLERPFFLEGPIVRGHGIGSKQTVPTLNLAPAFEVIPANGVYITRTRDLESRRKWDSITNIGVRPTFGGDTLSIETYLLSPFDGNTPASIRVEFLKRVRDERKFDSPEALRAQILKDVGRAQVYFRRTAKADGTKDECETSLVPSR